MLTGSIGNVAPASLSMKIVGMYEPVTVLHPVTAGKTSPTCWPPSLSASMLLRYRLMQRSSRCNRARGQQSALDQGYRTADIYTEGKEALLAL